LIYCVTIFKVAWRRYRHPPSPYVIAWVNWRRLGGQLQFKEGTEHGRLISRFTFSWDRHFVEVKRTRPDCG